jgi:hypothetical protein
VIDGRKRRAVREHEESARLLPLGSELRLVRWQDLFRLLCAPSLRTTRWASDLRAYLRRTALDTFEGIGQRLENAGTTTPLVNWHARSTAVSLSAGIRLSEAIAPLRLWGLAVVPEPIDLHHVARAAPGLRPLSSTWRLPSRIVSDSFSLRDCLAGVTEKQAGRLFSWSVGGRKA